MAEKKLVFGDVREVVWSERRDTGGMFDAEVGVWRDGPGFVAYVQGEWGGGANSRRHPDEQSARADVDRLWSRYF